MHLLPLLEFLFGPFVRRQSLETFFFQRSFSHFLIADRQAFVSETADEFTEWLRWMQYLQLRYWHFDRRSFEHPEQSIDL